MKIHKKHWLEISRWTFNILNLSNCLLKNQELADSLGHFEQIFELHINLKPLIVKEDVYSYFLHIY